MTKYPKYLKNANKSWQRLMELFFCYRANKDTLMSRLSDLCFSPEFATFGVKVWSIPHILPEELRRRKIFMEKWK